MVANGRKSPHNFASYIFVSYIINLLAEREGLSGGFIRSAYISEKSCDCGGLLGYIADYIADYLCRAQCSAPKLATIVEARNTPARGMVNDASD
jgi:hypothetical protein